ncbi:hypothetical protein FD755_024865, partial [Muntiacus reevesi]
AEGKEVKNLPEIRRLLEAVQLPRAVAIVHVPGHQKGEDLKARGNPVGLPPPGMGTLPPVPDYSLPDLAWINKDATLQKDDQDGWYRDQNNNLILPATLGRHLCEHLHTTTHLGEKKTLTLLQTACLRFPRQNAAVREIIQACKACQLMRAEKKQHSGMRYRGEEPGQHWEIDFTEVDGIGPWVHCNHVRQATPEEQEKARAEWKASPHPSNPLKLKLARREAS